MKNYKALKVVKKSYDENLSSTYDITVKDSHHYILEDGIVSHNTQDLFSQAVAGGGCLDPDSLVLMSNNEYKKIKDIKEGDFVSTLLGNKEVTHTWKFNKLRYEVEFEDGSKLITSEDHRFYASNNFSNPINDSNWIYVKDLKEGDKINITHKFWLSNNLKGPGNSKELEIISIKKLESGNVCDLTVQDAQHYITENGVINHNTGPEYAASIILFLTKAQLKEGENKTGIIVTAKPNKNRFAKPNNVKFHLNFSKGMNRYVGLETYISWENCGIEKGKFISEKEFDKMKESDKIKCTKNTYIEDGSEKINYFFPQETGRGYAVKHLNEVIKPIELFTSKVFTQEVLEMIDEKFIKPKFRYSDSADDSIDDLDLDLEEEIENE